MKRLGFLISFILFLTFDSLGQNSSVLSSGDWFKISTNNNGIFEDEDFFLFYGMSPDVWKFNETTNLFEHETHLFANEVNYFITIDNQLQGSRVKQESNLNNASKTITEYNAYAYHEQELENLIHSGRKWFGEQFSYDNSQFFNFSFPN